MTNTSSNPQSAGSWRSGLGALIGGPALLLLLYASLQEHVHALPHIKWLTYFTF